MPNQSRIQNIKLSLFVSLLLILATEMVSLFMLWMQPRKMSHIGGTHGWIFEGVYRSELDSELGWRLPKNEKYRSRVVTPEGEVVYDVEYQTDNFGRRIVADEKTDASRHLLLFGGSSTFSNGLADTDSVQATLATELSDTRVYNYAAHGYGPQQMLRKLETGFSKNEISQRSGDALYIFIGDHLNRAVGTSRSSYVFEGPYYRLEDSQIHHAGSFWTADPFRTRLLDTFGKISQASNFLTINQIQLPLSMGNRAVELTAKIIVRSARLYEQSFDGQFYVVMLPLYREQNHKAVNELVRTLRENSISVLDLAYQVSQRDFIPVDGHPSASFNQSF